MPPHKHGKPKPKGSKVLKDGLTHEAKEGKEKKQHKTVLEHRKAKEREALQNKVAAKKAKEEEEKAMLEMEMDEEVRVAGMAMEDREKEMRSKNEAVEKEKAAQEAIRLLMVAEANKEKIKRLDEIIENLLMIASGFNVKETTIVMDPERQQTTTMKDVETDIPLQKRIEALDVLWAISFKGEDYKSRIVKRGGTDILIKILEDFKVRAADHEKPECQNTFKSALNVIASLSNGEEIVPALSRVGTSELCIELLSDPAYTYLWAVALDVLGSMSNASKQERKKMQGEELCVIERIIGTKRVDVWDTDGYYGYLQTGGETCALQALKLVENLMTREEVRVQLLERTRAPQLFPLVLEAEHVEKRAAVCRIISGLCKSQWCRDQLKALGLESRICHAFINSTGNGYARASTGVALAALVSSTDEETARLAAPVAVDTLLSIKGMGKQRSWDFDNIVLPAVLHVLRSLCRQEFVQSMVMSKRCVMPLLLLIKNEKGNPISREHAAHVVGSVALQERLHESLFSFDDLLPALMVLVKHGEGPGVVAGARALQHLSSGRDPSFRYKMAEYVHVTLDATGSAPADIWTGMSTIVGLLQDDHHPACWEHGSGIMRNMTGLEEIRAKVMQDPSPSQSALNRLIALCGAGTTIVKMHSAAALGNLSTTEERAAVVVGLGGGKALWQLIKKEGKDPEVPVGPDEFLQDMRECAVRSLGVCANSDSVVEQLLKVGSIGRLHRLLLSKWPPLRLSAVRTLRNFTAYQAGALEAASAESIIGAIEKLLRMVEEDRLVSEVTASVANMCLYRDNIPNVVTPRVCRGLVAVLGKACNAARSYACNAARFVAQGKSSLHHGSLVETGVIPALCLLLDVQMETPGGCAECAAGAIARYVVAEEGYAARAVDAAALGKLIYLLRCGCVSAREQACKALLMFGRSQSYRIILLQIGGNDAARSALQRLEADSGLARQLLDMLSSTKLEAHQASSVERKIAERSATRNANSQSYWQKEELRQQQREKMAQQASPGGTLQPSPAFKEGIAYQWGEDGAELRGKTPTTPGGRRVTFSREAKRRGGYSTSTRFPEL